MYTAFRFNLFLAVGGFIIHLMKNYIQPTTFFLRLRPFLILFVRAGNKKKKEQGLWMSILLYSSSLLSFFLLGHNPVKCWASLVCNVSCGIYTFLCQEHYLLHQRQTLSSCRIICNLLDFTNLEVCLDIMYVGMFQNVLNILCISIVALQINGSTKFFFLFFFF